MLAPSKAHLPSQIKTPHSMVKKIRGFMAYTGPTPWFATPSFLGGVYGLNSPRDDSIVNYFNGLVGKSEQESIDFPII